MTGKALIVVLLNSTNTSLAMPDKITNPAAPKHLLLYRQSSQRGF